MKYKYKIVYLNTTDNYAKLRKREKGITNIYKLYAHICTQKFIYIRFNSCIRYFTN